MKTTFWFKPNLHWNVVREEVFNFLKRFGFAEDGRLAISYDDANPNHRKP